MILIPLTIGNHSQQFDEKNNAVRIVSGQNKEYVALNQESFN
jgi:hypothetical protein